MATRSTAIRIRLSPELKVLARKRADRAETTVSDLLRRMIAEGAPLDPISPPPAAARPAKERRDADDPVRAELRRIGGLLRHLDPGGKSWASPEDKRRWWQAVENIEALGRGRPPPHVIEQRAQDPAMRGTGRRS